jgi:hypothetical protein
MDVHVTGVVCVEAFRFFNLVFGGKFLYPTVELSMITGSCRCGFHVMAMDETNSARQTLDASFSVSGTASHLSIASRRL